MTGLRTLVEALEDAASTPRGYHHLQPDGSAREQPYARLFDEARAVAATLQARDLPRGSLIGIIAPDADAFLTAFMGTSLAGLVPAPLQAPAAAGAPATFARMLEPALRVARARTVITQDAIADRLRSADPPLADRIDVWRLPELIGPARADPARPRLDDPALVQFTSGSTADPRGVVLTHRALAENTRAIGGPHGLAFGDEDRGASWLPLYHDMGLIGMALSALYFTRPTTFLAPMTFLKRPVEWLRAIARERATVSFAPNFAYELCVRRVADEAIADLDLSCWRVAGCGAEPIRAATLDAFAAKFGRAGFRASSFTPCYGLAEHTLAVTISPPGRGVRVDRTLGDPAVSCGVSCPGHEIRIVDESGRPVADRLVGEIEARGPSMMREYFEAPDATGDTVRDGWLRTGDLGYLADGELFVCGRRKEMIVLHGRNCFPQDLEWIAGDAPGIRAGRIVAFGVPDRDRGAERLVLLVEAAGGADHPAIAADVRRRVSDAFGVYVDDVTIAPAGTIELTTSGKPKRTRAKEWYERRRP